MSTFTYNDTTFTVAASGAAWDVSRKLFGGPDALVAAGLFPGLAEDEAVARALALVKTILPVGVKSVGPDVNHPNTIGDLKIVGPDVTHPNFIYWLKDSASCPQEL
jgi:hypothetical protein